jgi:hypothetical protein
LGKFVILKIQFPKRSSVYKKSLDRPGSSQADAGATVITLTLSIETFNQVHCRPHRSIHRWPIFPLHRIHRRSFHYHQAGECDATGASSVRFSAENPMDSHHSNQQVGEKIEIFRFVSFSVQSVDLGPNS